MSEKLDPPIYLTAQQIRNRRLKHLLPGLILMGIGLCLPIFMAPPFWVGGEPEPYHVGKLAAVLLFLAMFFPPAALALVVGITGFIVAVSGRPRLRSPDLTGTSGKNGAIAGFKVLSQWGAFFVLIFFTQGAGTLIGGWLLRIGFLALILGRFRWDLVRPTLKLSERVSTGFAE